MYQRTVYKNQDSGDSSQTCPSYPVFIEGVWLSTVVELGLEVHVVTVDFRPFTYT
jgi:hypothetical protein